MFDYFQRLWTHFRKYNFITENNDYISSRLFKEIFASYVRTSTYTYNNASRHTQHATDESAGFGRGCGCGQRAITCDLTVAVADSQLYVTILVTLQTLGLQQKPLISEKGNKINNGTKSPVL